MTRPARRPARGESGFTLVEMIVAMLIAAVLIGGLTFMLLGQRKRSVNDAMVVAAQNFEPALGSYLRAYPPMGPRDTLLVRGNYSGPFTPSLPAGQGLYGPAGDPLLKQWPDNPFASTPTPISVKRGPCPAAGVSAPAAVGDVLVCRPGGAADRQQVRVIAWGKSPDTSGPVVVYDSIACSGRCPTP